MIQQASIRRLVSFILSCSVLWQVWDCICPGQSAGFHTPQNVPDIPEKLYVESLNDSSLLIQFSVPQQPDVQGSNGSPVTGYKVEIAQRVSAVQNFTVATDGSLQQSWYKLRYSNAYGMEETSCLNWNASAIEFQTVLEELLIIDDISVRRSNYVNGKRTGYTYIVTFDGPRLVTGQQSTLMEGSTSGCRPAMPIGSTLTFDAAHVTRGSAGFSPQVWEVLSFNSLAGKVLRGYFELSIGFEGDWRLVDGITVSIAPGSRIGITSSSVVGILNRGDQVKLGSEVFTVHAKLAFTDTKLPLDKIHTAGIVSGGAIFIRDTVIDSVRVTRSSATVKTSKDLSQEVCVGEYIKIGLDEFEVAAFPSPTSVLLSSTWNGESLNHITMHKRKKTRLSVFSGSSEVKLALEQLPGVGRVDVSRYGPSMEDGFLWTITLQTMTKENCPASPCLHVHVKKGQSNLLLTDAFGSPCMSCGVTLKLAREETNNQRLIPIAPDFTADNVIAVKEVFGSVNEIQAITVTTTSIWPQGWLSIYLYSSLQAVTLNYEDSAKDAKVKLEQLTRIGRVNVSCSGTTSNYDLTGSIKHTITWTITFLSILGDIPLFRIGSLQNQNDVIAIRKVVRGSAAPTDVVLGNLLSSKDYIVHGFARNIHGYSSGSEKLQSKGLGALPLTLQLGKYPDAPTVKNMLPISASEIILELAPNNDNGAPVVEYSVEFFPAAVSAISAVTKVFIKSIYEDGITGRFRLQFGDDKTRFLDVGTSSIDMEEAINFLPSMAPVSVSRRIVILAGMAGSRIIQVNAATRVLVTTPLTSKQAGLLTPGSRIIVDGIYEFIVRSQPSVGSTSISLQSVSQQTSVSTLASLVKVDPYGNGLGFYGFEWLITFTNDARPVLQSVYPGLLLLSSELRSASDGSSLPSFGISIGIADVIEGKANAHSALRKISTLDVCDTYTIGQPSGTQILQLYAPTTITQGSFKLQFGDQITANCISLGRSNIQQRSSVQQELESLLTYVKVSVEEIRQFKVTILYGTLASKVTEYTASTSTTGVLTVRSSGTGNGLTAGEADQLPFGARIHVCRNPNDLSRHSCEFEVVQAGEGYQTISVRTPNNAKPCDPFQNEARALKLLDFHDYKIHFWGSYMYGEWPTIKIVPEEFGKGSCAAWTPAVPVYGKVHTVRYEGECAQSPTYVQTIVADGLSTLGGYFTLSYRGKETKGLALKTTTAASLKLAIEEITTKNSVSVKIKSYGAFGKAWQVGFMPLPASMELNNDNIFIRHSFMEGKNSYMNIYPTIQVKTDALADDIRGSFRFTINGEISESIGYSATHAKVVQELQKLTSIDSVAALGEVSANDIGVYSLTFAADLSNSDTLSNLILGGTSFDPTLFLAIHESLTIRTAVYKIRSLNTRYITLDRSVPFIEIGSLVAAGSMTKTTMILPGYIRISPVAQVLNAQPQSPNIMISATDDVHLGDSLYIYGVKYTITSAVGNVISTTPAFQAPSSIVDGSPQAYVFDNILRTTSNLEPVLVTDDYIWLPSCSSQASCVVEGAENEYVRYTVKSVTSGKILVDGLFTHAIIRKQALRASWGREWTLIFRSFTGELNTFDVIPGLDLRGTNVRIGATRAKYTPKNAIRVGGPVNTQTVYLKALTPSCKSSDASYTLRFYDEAATFTWTTSAEVIMAKFKEFSEIDGLFVESKQIGDGYLHTLEFWGAYPQRRIKTLQAFLVDPIGNPTCAIHVGSNGAVSTSRGTHITLSSKKSYHIRACARNRFGVSKMGPAISTTELSTLSIVPTAPTQVFLGEFHGSDWLSVHYKPPLYDGGAPVTMYRLEWDISPNFDISSPGYGFSTIKRLAEVQEIRLTYKSNTGRRGTFTIALGGLKTIPLPYDCAPDRMSDALNALVSDAYVSMEAIQVSRTNVVSWGFVWRVTFSPYHGDIAPLIVDSSLLTGNFVSVTVIELIKGFRDIAIHSFSYNVKDILIDGYSPLSGTFVLSFQGKSTSPIDVGASAWELQELLLATTSSYSIKVAKQVLNAAIRSTIWSITYAYMRGSEAAGAGDVYTMQVLDSSQLLGSAASVSVHDRVIGTSPFRFYIEGLNDRTQYFFRTIAYNRNGYGSTNTPYSSSMICKQPDALAGVTISVVDEKSLRLSWHGQIANNMPCSIDSYKVEWFSKEGQQEEQTITISGLRGPSEIQEVKTFADSQSLTGFFKLQYGTEKTEKIAWNAPATGTNSMKSRIEGLSTIGSIAVTRFPSLRVIVGLMVTTVAASSTLQRNVDSSTMQLSQLGPLGIGVGSTVWILDKGYTIIAIDLVQDTITVNAPVRILVPAPVFTTAFGYRWLITFNEGHDGPQDIFKATTSEGWGGSNPGVIVTSIRKGVKPIGGTFRVSYGSSDRTQTTPPVPYNASSAELQTILEGLKTLGTVKVTRFPNGYGYNWVVAFISEVASDISLMIVDGTELQGRDVRITCAITKPGTQPQMYCEKDGGTGNPIVLNSPAHISVTIGGLLTGQPYRLRIRAHNQEGYGAAIYPTNLLYATPQKTPDKPQQVKAVALSKRFIKVIWEAPASDGGAPITSYLIQWDTSPVFANAMSPGFDMQYSLATQQSDGGLFYYNIPIIIGLEDVYYIRVFAINYNGKSPPAATESSVKPRDCPPGSPSNVRATVLTASMILVVWDAPSIMQPYFGGDGGLPLLQYVIEWDKSAKFDSPASIATVTGQTSHYEIGKSGSQSSTPADLLEPYTSYHVRVTAVNAIGAGLPGKYMSNPIFMTNKPPSAPLNFSVSIIDASTIKATWSRPLYDGGARLDGYKVQWNEELNADSVRSETLPIVKEMQSVVIESNVTNAVQYVDATVEVINEQQVLRTNFAGQDEIQVVKLSNDPVVAEVQTITTSTSMIYQEAEIRMGANDYDEIQAIRTTTAEVFEMQEVELAISQNYEVQTLSMTFTGGNGNMNALTGSLVLVYDSAACTFCKYKNIGAQATSNLLGSLQNSDNTIAAKSMEDDLNALANIQANGVTVSRISQPSTDGVDMIYTYSITFSGTTVAGDVPLLRVNSIIPSSQIPLTTTELKKGRDLVSSSNSIVTLGYFCEPYSDPYSQSFRKAGICDTGTLLCSGCIHSFDGLTLTGSNLQSIETISPNDMLVFDNCVFRADAVSATTITFASDPFARSCNAFTSQAFNLHRAKKSSVSLQVLRQDYTVSTANDMRTIISNLVGSVLVQMDTLVTLSSIKVAYKITFRERTGTLPLLQCTNGMILNDGSSFTSCAVRRLTIGSMIGGSFKLALPALTAPSPTMQSSDPIPWDASGAQMKTILESVYYQQEQVFGTVTVQRTVYAPTGNKWSGGFTWVITFTKRGWDIPRITAQNSLVAADLNAQPLILVEDEQSPFLTFPTGKSRDGNQITGSFKLTFGGVTSSPCVIGIDTSLSTLTESTVDNQLRSFILSQFPNRIDDIIIVRSEATQARGFTWKITHNGALNSGLVDKFDIESNIIESSSVIPATSYAYAIITKPGNQLGGEFRLQWNGDTTSNIPIDAEAATVERELNQLTSIRPSRVSVSRAKLNSGLKTYAWSITFLSTTWRDPTSDHSMYVLGNWEGPRAAWNAIWPETGYSRAWGRQIGPLSSKGLILSCVANGLYTTNIMGSKDCSHSVMRAGVGPIKGYFTLTISSGPTMSNKQSLTSGPISHNARSTRVDSKGAGDSLEEILEEMANIGDVSVSRSLVNPQTGTYTWMITFLRDAYMPCEQLADPLHGAASQEDISISPNADSLTRLCNSPGNIPAMQINTVNLGGSNPMGLVCEAALNIASPDIQCSSFASILKDGSVLRGYFSTLQVDGDPGFGQRYQLKVYCANPPCSDIKYFQVPAGNDFLLEKLRIGYKFTLGTSTSCVFTITAINLISVPQLTVDSLICPGLSTTAAHPMNMLLPWNADTESVKNVLEGSSDQSKELGIWASGRKVQVVRYVQDKYGGMSWHVRFVSNPSFTPPGSGNLPLLKVQFSPATFSNIPDSISVTKSKPGSQPLSGFFTIDFGSAFGPRRVAYNEDPQRFGAKLNEMNTISRVFVSRTQYPSTSTGCVDSSCAGGWENVPVSVDGQRGGYRWAVHFIQVIGEYYGKTLPAGSGQVPPLSVVFDDLAGQANSVSVYRFTKGSPPIVGEFALQHGSAQSPSIPYSADDSMMKLAIEALGSFRDVNVKTEALLTQRIPGFTASLRKDGTIGSITSSTGLDIREHIAPGNLIRFGPANPSDALQGTSGDTPVTSDKESSLVNVSLHSPVVLAPKLALSKVYPGVAIRIEGQIYKVNRSGYEVQKMTVTVSKSSFTPNLNTNSGLYALTFKRSAKSITSASSRCLSYDASEVKVHDELISLLSSINSSASTSDIRVTRIGPSPSSDLTQMGFSYLIYFLGDSVAGDISLLSHTLSPCATNPVTPIVSIQTIAHGGDIAHQRLDLTLDSGQMIDTQGYFQLKIGSLSTSCLTWGVSSSAMEAAIESDLSTGNVLVSKSGDGHSMTEIQRLRMTANIPLTAANGITALFRLKWTFLMKTFWTSCLPYGLGAEDLQVALSSMYPAGDSSDPHIHVEMQGDGSASWGYGYDYIINFDGPMVKGTSPVLGDVPQLQVINIGTAPCQPPSSGFKPNVWTDTIREGSSGISYDIYMLDYDDVSAFKLPMQVTAENCPPTNWIHSGGSSESAALTQIGIGGSAEIQRLDIRNKNEASKTFKLSLDGISTAGCIPFSAGISDLINALSTIPSIGVNGIRVRQDNDPDRLPFGTFFAITFVGDQVTGKVPLLQIILFDSTCQNIQPMSEDYASTMVSKPGGQVPSSFVISDIYSGQQAGLQTAYTVYPVFSVHKGETEVQRIIVSAASPTSFSDTDVYRLNLGTAFTTPWIPWDAGEEQMEVALHANSNLLSLDRGFVVTRRRDTVLAPHGYLYLIYFTDISLLGDQPLLTVASVSANFGGGSGAITVSGMTDGSSNGMTSKLSSTIIPLGDPLLPDKQAFFLLDDAILSIYKVNGILWQARFDSEIGDVPPLLVKNVSLVAPRIFVADNLVQGKASNTLTIQGLHSGASHQIQVAAVSHLGISAFTEKNIIPSGVPFAVRNVQSGAALYTAEIQQVETAATHVSEIQAITSSAAPIAEVQMLQIYAEGVLLANCLSNCFTGSIALRIPTVQSISLMSNAPFTGEFTIKFFRQAMDTNPANAGQFMTVGNTLETLPIAWNAEPLDVQQKLIQLSALDSDDIVVSRDGDGTQTSQYGYTYSITFIGNNVAGQTERMVTSVHPLCSSCAPLVTGEGILVNAPTVKQNNDMAFGTDVAIQRIFVGADDPISMGAFKLSFNHLGAVVVSNCIQYNAPPRPGDRNKPRSVEASLEAMSNIDDVFVTCSTDPTSAPNGFYFDVFFIGNGVYGDVAKLNVAICPTIPFMTTRDNKLIPTIARLSVVVLDYGGFNPSNTFVSASLGTDVRLQTDLNRLPVFRNVQVSRSLPDSQGGFAWTIGFPADNGDVPQLICAVTQAFASNNGAVCDASTVVNGNTLSGSFSIDVTPPLPFDASSLAVKSALEAIEWIGEVSVQRSLPTAQLGYTWTITFLDYVGDVPQLLVTNMLSGTGNNINVWELEKGNALNGSFTLAFRNAWTSPIRCNAAANALESGGDGSSMQEKLQYLETIGSIQVSRAQSQISNEGSYIWSITFIDDSINSGDLPLLEGNATGLTGVGATLSIRESVKGSEAVGDRIWLSFDAPLSDRGDSIVSYHAQWDTSPAFTDSPSTLVIPDSRQWTAQQTLITEAPSLAWSKLRIDEVPEVQTLLLGASGAFRLSFRGEMTASSFSISSTSTTSDVGAALSNLASITSITVSPVAVVLSPALRLSITFTGEIGDLPLLVADNTAAATIEKTRRGSTNYRKEINVFSCDATSGSIQFSVSKIGQNTNQFLIPFDASLTQLQIALHKLFNVEQTSIIVRGSQNTLCAQPTPSRVTITFHRVYGNVNMQITRNGADLIIAEANIVGIYNEAFKAVLTGSYTLAYAQEETLPLNAQSSSKDVRYALERLESVQTATVERIYASQLIPLAGTVDVVSGQIYVTCSDNQSCDFDSAKYGIPGTLIQIGGSWYNICSDLESMQGQTPTRLYLGDTNGNEVGYRGKTAKNVPVYEWTKGFEYKISILKGSNSTMPLTLKLLRLSPESARLTLYGKSCAKCCYLPGDASKPLVVGQPIYIRVYAYNKNGRGESSSAAPVKVVPNRIPNAPANVGVLVLSSKELEVYFSPPVLPKNAIVPSWNDEIFSYLVQWDTDNRFLHGHLICDRCAVSLQNAGLMTTISLQSRFSGAINQFWIDGNPNCVLTVISMPSSTRINVGFGVQCPRRSFSNEALSLYYYRYPPAEVTGIKIAGSPPFRYTISGLQDMQTYYVRVAAVNSIPVQQISLLRTPQDNRKWSSTFSAVTKDVVPDSPISVTLAPFSGSAITLYIWPSLKDGRGMQGAGVTHYWIDKDEVATFDSIAKSVPVLVVASSLPTLYIEGPLVYYIYNLKSGTEYFVQVKAINSIGASRATISTNSVYPRQNTSPPQQVKVTLPSDPVSAISNYTANTAIISWQSPADDGGSAITSYKVEWWTTASRPEIQLLELRWLTIPTSPISFALSFGGVSSGSLPHNITPENLRNALMNLYRGSTALIGPIKVSRVATNNNLGYQWAITFLGSYNIGDQPMLQLSYSPSSGVFGSMHEVSAGISTPSSTIEVGKPEVQVVVISHNTLPAGFFRLSFQGFSWTPYLRVSASAIEMEAALEQLPSIGQVKVAQSFIVAANAYVWQITFISNVGDQPKLLMDRSKIIPQDAFAGVKDGDNAVTSTGVLCLPGDDPVTCPGSWAGYSTLVASTASIGESPVDYRLHETANASLRTYQIANLVPGVTYYASVTAKNLHGYSNRVTASATGFIVPLKVPSSPKNVSIDVSSGSANKLTARWDPPLTDGGSFVQMYRIQYDNSPLFDGNRGEQNVWCPTAPTYAVWRIQTSRVSNTVINPISKGFFQLTLRRNFLNIQSEPIPWNAVAMSDQEIGSSTFSDSKVFCTPCASCTDTCASSVSPPLFLRREKSGSMQSKLEYIKTISNGVKVSTATPNSNVDGGYTWMITFLDSGDDFLLIPSTNMLYDTFDDGGIGKYTISATKLIAGDAPSVCTGQHVFPSIGDLNKGQLYYARIFAYNQVGFSLPAVANYPQKPMIAPGLPTAVTMTVKSSSKLEVTFSDPADDGGDEIIEYLVEYATNSQFTDAKNASVTILKNGAPYSRILSGLQKGTSYFTRVKARNSQGLGQAQTATPLSLNPATTPTAPTNAKLGVTTSTMLTVGWDAPDDDGGDAILAYIVQWDITATFDNWNLEYNTAVITDTTSRAFTVTRLQRAVTYFLRVSARNSIGTGVYQLVFPYSADPRNQRPGKPHTLAVQVPLTPKQLVVTWQEPKIPAHGIPCGGSLSAPLDCGRIEGSNIAVGGSQLYKYEVQYSTTEIFTSATTIAVRVTSTSLLLTDLISSIRYYVRVLAINKEGFISDFCHRQNMNTYLCPDNLLLPDGQTISGLLASGVPL